MEEKIKTTFKTYQLPLPIHLHISSTTSSHGKKEMRLCGDDSQDEVGW